MAEKNFGLRTDEETIAQFKEIAGQFDTSGACFKALLDSYELQMAKKNLSGYRTSIEDFESLAGALVRNYISALDINLNAEERVRKDFQTELSEKDEKIAELKSEYDSAVETADKALKEQHSFKNENKALKKEIADKDKQISDLSSQIAEKDKLNKNLLDNCDRLKEEINGIKSELTEVEQIKVELKTLKEENTSLKAKNQEIQVQYEGKLLEAERNRLETERKLENSHKTDIETYQQKIAELLTIVPANANFPSKHTNTKFKKTTYNNQ